VLTTDQKGAIAETAIMHHAAKLGVGVYRPVCEGGRYDLILDTGDRLLRVQCKFASRYRGILVIRCYSCRRSRDGMVVRRYTATEVDAIAAYSAALDSCYLLTPEHFAGRRAVHLRVEPSRNNQRRGINWAEDFEFGATLMRFGAVAQLGERLAGSQ
jgi:hypothetical protein